MLSDSSLQEKHCPLTNPDVNCRVRNSPLLVSVQRQMNQTHILTYYFSKVKGKFISVLF